MLSEKAEVFECMIRTPANILHLRYKQHHDF